MRCLSGLRIRDARPICQTQPPEILNQALPLAETDWARLANPNPREVALTWIGHSSFLVQLGGVAAYPHPECRILVYSVIYDSG
jgi:hypothetical protein